MADEIKKFSTQARVLREQFVNSPDWDSAPLIADRVTWEIAKFADPDAIIIQEAGAHSIHSFNFNPIGGRELFFYYGGHLGSGVGTAAGVKLARPNQQVIALIGDGSFIFGPTALWNMARLELPVITIIYNNHAYGGPHSRVINNVPSGRMVQTGQFVHDYLGNPDMDMVAIAKGFGVDGEIVRTPMGLREALQCFIRFREEVILRRTRFELGKARDRAQRGAFVQHRRTADSLVRAQRVVAARPGR